MKKESTFIIAEAGINHNGNPEIAQSMIDAAAESGADAIKFQTYKAERVMSVHTPKTEYQNKATKITESQVEMARKFELSKEAHEKLLDHCDKKGIMFLSSPFDMESIDLLAGLRLKIFKIPSCELTNLPYLRKIGGLRKKIILSTGMADLDEVGDALDILVGAGTALKNITVLHCVSDYPASMELANLLGMNAIKNRFKVKVGYSDHTIGIEVPVAAVALGAKVIEKHFTLSRCLPGPDQKASLEPRELKEMILAIRNIEKALGDGVKRASPPELKNRAIARKSIVAQRSIGKGEVFTQENITVKRPGAGISPMDWDKIIGRKAKKCFAPDELIQI